MPSLREYESFVRAMREDRRTCCLGSTYIISMLLLKVGLIWYILNNNNKASPYLFLSASAIWLLLICCGWTIRSSMNPFSDLPTFLWCSVVLAIVLGLTTLFVLLLRSVYNADNTVNVEVTDAALTHFNLSGNNPTSTTLNYNLAVKVTVGPNKKKAGVYYESLQAWASYQGLNFASVSLPPFYLSGKGNHTSNSSMVILQPLVFQGQQQLVLPADALKLYRQDEAAGRFSIDVTVSYLGFRGSAGAGHGHKLKGVQTFALKELPLPNATSGWVEAGADSLPERVAGDVVGISVSAFLLLSFLCCCWCALKQQDEGATSCLVLTLVCILPLLITIAILIPDLVRTLKKVDQVKLMVSNATLTQFNLSSSTINSSTLSYNLSLAVTVGPSHKKTGVYFSKLEAAAYYQGQNFTSLALSPFYLQGRQQDGARTVILRPVFQGQQVLTMLPGGDGLTKYREETAARKYSIVVTLSYSGIRTDNSDYNNNTASTANETLTKDDHKQIIGVATFELKVPLLSNPSGTNGAVSSGAANVFGSARQNDVVVLVMIPVFLMLHLAFEF